MRALLIALAIVLALASPAAGAPGGCADGNAGAGGESVAQVTLVHSSYDNGAVRLEFDYNQNTGDVLRFRCVNNTDFALHGEVVRVDPVTQAVTNVWAGDCQPHTTVTLPVSKFNLAWDTVDGGLIMGDYQIRTHWPA